MRHLSIFANACRGNRPRWHVYIANVLKLPFLDGEFDVAAIYSSLHHISSSAESVCSSYLALRTGGLFCLRCCARRNTPTPALALVFDLDGGVRYYTREEVAKGRL